MNDKYLKELQFRSTVDYINMSMTTEPLLITNPDERIPNPHYSNKLFEKEQTLYGKYYDKLNYVYSNRLFTEYYHKYDKVWYELKEKKELVFLSANFYQALLISLFEKELKIKHIIGGVNKSNGNPYLIFGYKYEN